MTPAVRRAVAHVLRRASDEFSNHGCNELDLSRELGLQLDAAGVAEVRTFLDLHGFGELTDSPVIDDWVLMLAAAKHLENRLDEDE